MLSCLKFSTRKTFLSKVQIRSGCHDNVETANMRKGLIFQSRSRGEIKSRTNIELFFFVEEKLPDRTHLSERGQPEKKGGGGDQKKVLSGNEMDVQGGDYDFLFKVNCAHNYRCGNIEDFCPHQSKKSSHVLPT